MEREQDAIDLVRRAAGLPPVSAERQRHSNSGNVVYRVFLDDGQSVVLRISPKPRTFVHTARNLGILRSLRIPVQRVLAVGLVPAHDSAEPTTRGSFIILNWIPGRDLLDELPGMTAAQMTAAAGQIVECQRRLATLPQGRGFGWAPIGAAAPLKQWTEVFGTPHPELPPEDGTLLGSLRRRLCQMRAELEPYFASIRPVCFLDDLTTKNAIMETGILRGIIDADFVCYGDPLMSVGTTLASLAADMNEPADFYGSELVRCWNPDPTQHLAIRFYTALWMIGILSLPTSPNPTRAQRLTTAAEATLTRAAA